MEPYIIMPEHIQRYAHHLRLEEHALATIAKYLRDLKRFAVWLNGQPVAKEQVLGWKEHLGRAGRCAGTVNGALSALHRFFGFMQWQGLRVRFLKV